MTQPAGGVFWRARIFTEANIELTAQLGAAPAPAPHIGFDLTADLGMVATMQRTVAIGLALTTSFGATASEHDIVTAAPSLTASLAATAVEHSVVAFVGAAINTDVAGGTSVTLPAHQVGDLIVICAYDAGSSNIPGKPAAAGTVPSWIDIDIPAGGNSNAARSAYAVATATNHTSGVWAGAERVAAVVCRNQNTTTPIGGHALTGGQSASGATAPAVTLSNSDGGSVLLHFGFRRDDQWTAWSAAPTGYTNRASYGAGADGGFVDTKNTTTTAPAMTHQTDGNHNTGYRGATIEVVPF